MDSLKAHYALPPYALREATSETALRGSRLTTSLDNPCQTACSSLSQWNMVAAADSLPPCHTPAILPASSQRACRGAITSSTSVLLPRRRRLLRDHVLKFTLKIENNIRSNSEKREETND
jgi:hypothetical protein